jgi:hypothetical protein
MAEVPTRGPAVCSGCESVQRYTLAHTAPRIAYRLDALVDRATDQGVLPHLLVMAALRAQDPDCSLLPGVDLTFANGDHPLNRRTHSELVRPHGSSGDAAMVPQR